MGTVPKVVFILCTESGELEQMSMLLIDSIRKFGGNLKDSLICSFQPRKGKEVSKKTISFFEERNVEFIDLNLNKDFIDYPLANKPIVCSYAEKTINTDILIFLDSDTLFINEPIEFILSPKNDVSLRPVDVKNIGVRDISDKNYSYWKKLYSIAECNDISYVHTAVENEKIYSYWNTGHIIAKTSNNLFSQWEENFYKIMHSNIFPKSGIFYVEQSCFAATVSAKNLNVKELSNSYNYPIHLHHKLPLEKKIESLEAFTSFHYHKIFNNEPKNNPLMNLLKNHPSNKSKEITRMLARHKLIPSKIKMIISNFLN